MSAYKTKATGWHHMAFLIKTKNNKGMVKMTAKKSKFIFTNYYKGGRYVK